MTRKKCTLSCYRAAPDSSQTINRGEKDAGNYMIWHTDLRSFRPQETSLLSLHPQPVYKHTFYGLLVTSIHLFERCWHCTWLWRALRASPYYLRYNTNAFLFIHNLFGCCNVEHKHTSGLVFVFTTAAQRIYLCQSEHIVNNTLAACRRHYIWVLCQLHIRHS